ncbi:MAG: ABC transporter substrate-binding protein [Granulosicoccus sp.]
MMLNTLNAALLCALLVTLSSHERANASPLAEQSWDDIVDMARGSEVNWFLWGGSDNINQYVSDYIGSILNAEYDISLRRVGVNDTVEAVNIVLGEKESGVDDKGAVDLVWINGENFRTMKQAELAFCGYTETLPNNRLIDWENPAIANDFGVPVDGCEVPWSRAQFAFAYDTARMSNPPNSMAQLLEWIKANPQKFTYPAPPDFNGSVFVRHVFYHVAGGADKLLGEFNQETFDLVSRKTWQVLNELKPYLWREGRTYPNSITALDQLYANQEVNITFNYEPAVVGLNIDNGIYPPTTQGYGLLDGTIANTNYTLIPYNSPNKAAAMVLQNVLLSGRAQLEKARPEVWGALPAIEIDRTTNDIQTGFRSIEQHPAVVPAEELAQRALPELQASWISAIEEGWQQHVGR